MTATPASPRVQPDPITRLERAQRLQRQADRLCKFIEIRAPEYIIESARWSLAKTLARFPISEQHMQDVERGENELWVAEQDHLHKTGYYADIDRQMNDLDGGAATGEAS